MGSANTTNRLLFCSHYATCDCLMFRKSRIKCWQAIVIEALSIHWYKEKKKRTLEHRHNDWKVLNVNLVKKWSVSIQADVILVFKGVITHEWMCQHTVRKRGGGGHWLPLRPLLPVVSTKKYTVRANPALNLGDGGTTGFLNWLTKTSVGAGWIKWHWIWGQSDSKQGVSAPSDIHCWCFYHLAHNYSSILISLRTIRSPVSDWHMPRYLLQFLFTAGMENAWTLTCFNWI